MIPVNNQYPSFAANQVLSSEHLNQLFAYLDEQGRLTRTNLIGIGIVCGLEPTVAADGSSIRISKGCGVTSEGYLIVWEDVGNLEWYRPYSVPDALAYHEFENQATSPVTPFPMWELMPDRNNDPAAVRLSASFLSGSSRPEAEADEKILVLFLECKLDSNRNCSPNNCDDKGFTVNATIRPLLIRKRDIDLLQARVRALGPDTEAYFSLAGAMSSRLGLPDMRLPRFDVPATGLGTTSDVFNAFQRAMNRYWIENLADALSAVYQAFRPVLLADYASNPFQTLRSDWAFLHNGAIVAERRYLWYQYYYDHLDTILQAYEELRDQGLELLGLCCPDSRLFPRHLMLANVGVAPPDYAYRHTFVPSPIFGHAQGGVEELRQLFQRLVHLVLGLELPPALNPTLGVDTITDGVIFNPTDNFTFGGNLTFVGNFFGRRLGASPVRITPSQLRSPLSTKAIPYHYQPVPLYRYWNYKLSRQGKARLNLGYRHAAWNTTDDFVRNPLHYDLEPHNFLRIEGHVGQPFTQVVAELLAQKSRYRLPIDVVAIKTGRSAADILLPQDLEGCHFQDLEALYDAFREELVCQICETVRQLYNTLVVEIRDENTTRQPRLPQLPFLRACAPEFRYFTRTVGELYENNLALHTANEPSYVNVPQQYIAHVFFIFHLVRVAESLSDTLSTLDWETFRSRYHNLRLFVRGINTIFISALNEAENPAPNLPAGVDMEEFSDQLDQLIYACKLETIQSIREEYDRRVAQLQQAMLLSRFAAKHPGLQHKAGVPLGGTFVVVYHGEEQVVVPPTRKGPFRVSGFVTANGEPLPGVSVRTGPNSGVTTDAEGRFSLTLPYIPITIEVSFVGFSTRQIQILNEVDVLEIDLANANDGGANNAFNELGAGTVIADFFLPYLCCSDCQPIQFVLPLPPPTFAWRQVDCTNSDQQAHVEISPSGGTAPYEYSIDNGNTWLALGEDDLELSSGTTLRIRDVDGLESTPQTILLRDPLSIDTGQPVCDDTGQTFSVEVFVSGGQAPYTMRVGDETVSIPANQSGRATFPSGQGGEIFVADSSEPACESRISVEPFTCEQLCNLPCGGVTLDCGHPFFLQNTRNPNQPYIEVTVRAEAFQISGEAGSPSVVFDGGQLKDLTAILNPSNTVDAGSFDDEWGPRIKRANEYIHREIEGIFGAEVSPVLFLDYEPGFQEVFTTLRIEHYRCFNFRLQLLVSYRDIFENRYEVQWEYRNDVNPTGAPSASSNFVMRMTNPNGQTQTTRGTLPGFDCIERDRCNDGAERRLCDSEFNIKVAQTGEGRSVNLRVTPASRVNLPTLWSAYGAAPTLVSGNRNDFLLLDSRVRFVVIVVDPVNTCASTYVHEVQQLG